jgi:hypothetical protein
MQSVQLSHEELLMLLGMLRLPMPLALGEDPTEGYTEASLNAALVGALGGLMARGYVLQAPVETDEPKLIDGLANLISVSALAEGCLMLTARQGDLNHTTHYVIRDGQFASHSSPIERVHRLEWLGSSDAIIDRLVTTVMPQNTVDAPLSFNVDAEALSMAVEAAAAGQSDAAQANLLRAGVDNASATAFVSRMGPAVVRYALVSFRDLLCPQPIAQSSVIIQGNAETWYAEAIKPDSDQIAVQSIDTEGLRTRLSAHVQHIAASPTNA